MVMMILILLTIHQKIPKEKFVIGHYGLINHLRNPKKLLEST